MAELASVSEPILGRRGVGLQANTELSDLASLALPPGALTSGKEPTVVPPALVLALLDRRWRRRKSFFYWTP